MCICNQMNKRGVLLEWGLTNSRSQSKQQKIEASDASQ